MKPKMEQLKNKILLGDCLDVMRSMPDNSVDLLLTDPPYGIDAAGAGGVSQKGSRNSKCARREFERKTWDAARPSREVFSELLRVSKCAVIFGGNYFADLLPASRCWLVWDKVNGTTSFADCELAWANLSDSVRKIEYRWQGMLCENASDKEDRFHPTQKPVGLFQRILEKYAPPGSLIFDPFSGSGTTAIACHNLGLDFICVEKDPDYHAASVERLRKHRQQLLLPGMTAPVAVQQELF